MRQGLIIVALLVALSISSYKAITGYFSERQANAKVVLLESRLAASEELRGLIAKRTVELQTVQQVKRGELNAVLKENPEWSGTAVPSAISTRLCSTLRCQ